ncbi:hypothetical protein DFH09DRAFT_1302387 [Mycena vulgaris]|nr:hypothetical protein DFH09DRAFT_1302387 [Mycena vulgaris]
MHHLLAPFSKAHQIHPRRHPFEIRSRRIARSTPTSSVTNALVSFPSHPRISYIWGKDLAHGSPRGPPVRLLPQQHIPSRLPVLTRVLRFASLHSPVRIRSASGSLLAFPHDHFSCHFCIHFPTQHTAFSRCPNSPNPYFPSLFSASRRPGHFISPSVNQDRERGSPTRARINSPSAFADLPTPSDRQSLHPSIIPMIKHPLPTHPALASPTLSSSFLSQSSPQKHPTRKSSKSAPNVNIATPQF